MKKIYLTPAVSVCYVNFESLLQAQSPATFDPNDVDEFAPDEEAGAKRHPRNYWESPTDDWDSMEGEEW